ncbi:glycosyltransferase [Phycobacter sp. K97]|uniref:glycosyltransferase n=1 Tax=Phycobacter sedimenti TaxID=3133977 RepID=UPI00311EC2A7
MVKSRRGLRRPGKTPFRPLVAPHASLQGAPRRSRSDEPPLGRNDIHSPYSDASNQRQQTISGTPETLHRLILSQHGKPVSEQEPIGSQTRPVTVAATSAARHPKRSPARFRHIDLDRAPPDKSLLNRMPPAFWLRHATVPWLRLGNAVVVAMADLSQVQVVQDALGKQFGKVIPISAPEDQILKHLTANLGNQMARRASISLPQVHSSRFLADRNLRAHYALWASLVLSLSLLFPMAMFIAACGMTLLLLVLFTGFRLAGIAGFVSAQHRSETRSRTTHDTRRLPRISILVPLFQEAEISKDLLKRLAKVEYTHHLLEIFLVLEDGDRMTLNAVRAAVLPTWIKVVKVPEYGDLKTKPRALNYALNFCRGDIIGVWDAEDSPMADQLHEVAAAFAKASPEVACVQGILDYYNPRTTWISRCFTLEYASWFRIILPGIAKLGLVVPLGGTTMFVRRQVLEEVGAWDAHNVTEDADLGVRLCRAGYRTEMLASTTYEEANAHVWPWIKQRSRWLKGFMMTYATHMRAPRQLLRDLGWRQFLGLQVFFLCSVGQFLLAPILWSFWLVAFGLPHPAEGHVPGLWLSLAVAVLVFFELLSQATAICAAFASKRRRLALWAPCLLFYYLLGAAAAYKALYELVFRPFFWDKTNHGIHAPDPASKNECRSAR